MNEKKFEKLYAPKRERVEQLIKFLKERPRPIYSIQNQFKMDRTTVRSYIITLRDIEVDVKKDELNKYYI